MATIDKIYKNEIYEDEIYKNKNKEQLLNQEIESVKLFFIYINNVNEIYNIKEVVKDIKDEMLTKEEQLYIIKENQFNMLHKHKLVSLCYYNIDIASADIRSFINDKLDTNFLHNLDLIETIKFKKTISILHSLNSVFFIFKYLNIVPHSNTKKIVIKSNNKTRKQKVTSIPYR